MIRAIKIILITILLPNCNRINPLLELGGCYTFNNGADSVFGLILYDVGRSDKGVIYYSFLMSGKLLSKSPSLKEFMEAGVWGRFVAAYEPEDPVLTFNSFMIAEKDLKPELKNLNLITKLTVSKKIGIGSSSFLESLNKLSQQINFFHSVNEKMESEKSPIRLYPNEIFPIDRILAKK